MIGLNSDSMRTAGCVLYILKFYKDPFDTLRMCIRIGGDVDSLGSICLGNYLLFLSFFLSPPPPFLSPMIF